MGARSAREAAAGEHAAGERATGEHAAGERATGEHAAGERATGERLKKDRLTFGPRTGLADLPLRLLVAAHERGDRPELLRLSTRFGPDRLAAAITGRDERAVAAALDTVALLTERASFVEPVSTLLTARGQELPREHLAIRAAHLLGDLLGDRAALARWEVPPDVLTVACRAVARIATSELSDLETRVAALQALAEAGGACGPLVDPAALAGQIWPEVRRAVALLATSLSTPARANARNAVGDLVALLRDPIPRVALATVASLCGLQQRGAPWPVLPPPLRTLLTSEEAAPEDVVEALPCLFRSPRQEDRQVVEFWARRRATPAAERARELIEGR